MSYKLILLSDLKPTDLKMVLRPHAAVDIIRELHLHHTQIWDLDWHNEHADFMSSPADKYARVIEKLLLGHVVLLQWPQAQFDGVIGHDGNVHISMQMGIGNELLSSKVKTLQQTIATQESHSPVGESKPTSKPIIAPANTLVATPARTMKDAAVEAPFEIEVELLDGTDTPIANAEYILKLATGEEQTGQLDGEGYKLFSGAEYKQSQIHFPQYEGYDWEPAVSTKSSTPSSKMDQENVLTPEPVEDIIPVPVLENVTVLDVEPINFDVELKTVSKYPIADAEFIVEFEDGSTQQGRLDEKGFHHLESIPEGHLTITYSDYDDIFIKSLAAQLREAFDTRSNNTVFRILSKSSDIVQKVVEVYDQYYNDYHGKGLVNDILGEFTIPSYRLAVIGLLVAGGVDVGGGESYFPVELTENTLLAIKPQPAISSIIKESSFNLSMHRQQSVIESTDAYATYKWFVIHDEQAVMTDGASPITFLDDEFSIDYKASYYGQHIVMCCYQYHPGDGSVQPAEYYSYPINVSNVHSILAPDVEAAETIMQQPDVALIAQQRYIDTLKQVASNTEMDDKTTDKHEEELEELAENAERLDELIKSSADKRRYPIKAVAITTATSIKQPLKVFVYQKRVDDNWFSDDEHVWGLVDWTYCGNTAFCGEYEGAGASAQDAIANVLQDWQANARLASEQPNCTEPYWLRN